MKKYFWGACAFGGMLLLILAPQTAVDGASSGLQQCIQVVVPSLFPFFFLSGILCRGITGTDLAFLRPIGRILGIPTGCEGIMLLGFLGGYPVGAQAVATAWKEEKLSVLEAQRMLGFCSNAGPSFIFGMAAQFFSSPLVPWMLWLIHILSALIVGYFLPGKKVTDTRIKMKKPQKINITDALSSALKVTGTVCGWIVLFRLAITYLEQWIISSLPYDIKTAISGFLELANGCLMLGNVANHGVRFILCSVMLGFGGCCVWLQTRSVTEKLGTGYYIPGKMLQAMISFILSWVAVLFLFPSELNLPWLFPCLMFLLVIFVMYRIRKNRIKGGNYQLRGV